MDSDTPREEDVAFEEWKHSHSEASEDKLRRLLIAHASAVCVEKLGARDPEITNMAVYLAFRHVGKFRGESKFSSWFHAIVKNLCNRALREKIQARSRERAIDDLTAEEMVSLSTSETPDLGRLLEQLSGSLRADDRELLELKRQGLSGMEIAAALGVAEGTVWARWHKLRQRIVSWLGEGGRDAGTLVGEDCHCAEKAEQ